MKHFMEPEVEITKFTTVDVIATSGGDEIENTTPTAPPRGGI